MLKFVVFVALAVLCLQSEAKRFDRCGLVRELRRQGFPEDKMRDWVCLVEKESSSSLFTDKTDYNPNGSRNYGLFHITDTFWCSNTSTPGKDCNVTCSDLLTDDITKASKCAKKVFERHGFNGWYGWKKHCQAAGSLPDISSC